MWCVLMMMPGVWWRRDLEHPIKSQTPEQREVLADKYHMATKNREMLLNDGADEHVLMFAGPPP